MNGAITDEQRRRAWLRIQRPGWPPTLAGALAHPVYRACLDGIARNLAREALARSARPATARPLPLFDHTDESPAPP